MKPSNYELCSFIVFTKVLPFSFTACTHPHILVALLPYLGCNDKIIIKKQKVSFLSFNPIFSALLLILRS